MKITPLLFSGPMVRALLEGRKTQTRRVIKSQPPNGCAYTINGSMNAALCHSVGPVNASTIWVPPTPTSKDHLLPCPYGHPGDLLWVRETGWINGGYVATDKPTIENDGKTPSIFMPKSTSRITLLIKTVRVEMLQDISEADAIAEGCVNSLYLGQGGRLATENYRWLWESINGDESWADNPWVWVIEVDVKKQNVIEYINQGGVQ